MIIMEKKSQWNNLEAVNFEKFKQIYIKKDLPLFLLERFDKEFLKTQKCGRKYHGAFSKTRKV